VIPPAPAYPTKTPKHTRFDVPDSPGLGIHGRSNSEPLTSDALTRPSTSHSPPDPAYSNIAFSPILPPRPSTAGSNHTGLSGVVSGLPSAAFLNHDVPARPQSPGYAVHTELWRQQQHQWILDERRQISAQYERLRREQEQENEQVREEIRRERERDRKNSMNLYKEFE
jgi:hypothetical protein